MITGKGFFLWQIPGCEGGDTEAIADLAEQAGLAHVLVKITDGPFRYNTVPFPGGYRDLVPPLLLALRARGIACWGWGYIYGKDPLGEAAVIVERVKQLQLDGFVVNAEGEFKRPSMDKPARLFLTRLRSGLPDLPVSISSYRFPKLHPQFPWTAFLEQADFSLPQVYWMQRHDPAAQLARCLAEYRALVPARPVVPTGAAFKERSWAPTPADATAFLDAARRSGLKAANYWSWDNCRKNLPAVWQAIAGYAWTTPKPTPPPAPSPEPAYRNYRLRQGDQGLNVRERPWRSGPEPKVLWTIRPQHSAKITSQRDGAWGKLWGEPGWARVDLLEEIK